MRIATRRSPLARWQAERVANLLRDLSDPPQVEVVAVDTSGDRARDVPLDRIGGQGVFVKDVQAAVLDGRADLAVHSAKDLPGAETEGLVLAAVPERADRRDAMVGMSLAELPTAAIVATGSNRRRAQLAWIRPDLKFVGLRGNIATRLDRTPRSGAVVVAVAALERLGLEGRATQILEPADMLPQVGQGALAVECRADDEESTELAREIDVAMLHSELSAERSFLAALGAGCTLPVAASANVVEGVVTLEGLMASRDGRIVLRRRAEGSDPVALGRSLASDLLWRCGGTSLGDWSDDSEIGADAPRLP
ncbi:MAG TPA: hydroxymethylbilane synthase [Acidimicrobiales bacterium]|nr:hydroxymethylbilane synthase [Acidimicrobiales bacterium]